MQYEFRYLSAGIKNIVTDSPPFLSGVYSELYCKELGFSDQIFEIEKAYDRKYPSLNIYLQRGDKPYVTEGRNETPEQAKEVDVLVKNFLDKYEKTYYVRDFQDRQGILDLVLEHID